MTANENPTGAAAPGNSDAPSTAADAAVKLITSKQAAADLLDDARQLRQLALAAITISVFAFMICTLSGVLLGQWAEEGFVIKADQATTDLDASMSHVQFTDANSQLIHAAHWLFGALAFAGLLAYLYFHMKFRTAYAKAPIPAEARKKPPHGPYVAGLALVMLVVLAAGFVTGYAMPKKPTPTETFEHFKSQEATGKSIHDIQREEQNSLAPYYMVGREAEWMTHLLVLPGAFSILVFVLLLAVYSVQRCSIPDENAAKQAKKT